MNLSLVEPLRYNDWANRTLFDACRELTEQQLDVLSAAGSVRELLVHLVGAQENYIHWTQGQVHDSEFTRESEWPGIGPLADVINRTSRELISIAERTAPESEVDLTHHGLVHRYPLRFLLTSVVEHGIRHRTEIVLTLMSGGIATPDLDGWAYARAVGYGAELPPPVPG